MKHVICKHTEIESEGALFFNKIKEAETDIKLYRAYLHKIIIKCNICGKSKNVFMTTNA
jgi:hypothetical protein